MPDINNYNQDDQVRHERFGNGSVVADMGLTVVVRFEHGIEECQKSVLQRSFTPLQGLYRPSWDTPIEVIVRTQAEIIEAINDAWGVFSRSRIALLPHQLWVCRRVLEQWPSRWLVADDVGLGKTIEAGLILWPLISKGLVKRLLILAPASLVTQWQYRLKTMFDIRMASYVTESDTEKTDFWNTQNQVVASVQTLRKDHKGRQRRLIESEPWDLVVVDEAHHLNADEKGGPTLGYQLVKQMLDEKRIQSMVFFTGTPHRGKNFGFLSLLRLLREDLFDPQKDLTDQLAYLPQVMIRNNKQNVTDLKGNKLFQPPIVKSETYTYSTVEEQFYETLTEFIISGKTYASSLDQTSGQAVMLVLITMQKLASSSVAAIRRALKKRLGRILEIKETIEDLDEKIRKNRRMLSRYAEYNTSEQTDEQASMEERMIELEDTLALVQDEEPRLKELITAAEVVQDETKIKTIISVLKEKYQDRAVLFFTEYKATQSLLLSALFKEFGDGCAGFINGEDRAEGVVMQKGLVRDLTDDRERTADRFNAGEIRFLVSTEAGGEGIDLQERCHTLIHVDLPWNPMRLHQRVGRVNRYGQKKQVEVMNLRNPQTVEARIWDKLNTKIVQIQRALSQVMDDPEDLFQLVLGMTPNTLFNEIFTEARDVPPEAFSDWFDQKTARFGGKDVIQAVQDLMGNCTKFDYQQVSDQLPQVDLPDLKPFLVGSLTFNGRRVKEDENGLSFITPDAWRNEPAVWPNYEDMLFDRNARTQDAAQRILGVGHAAVNQAIKQAKTMEASVTTLPKESLKMPLVVYQIRDRVTTEGGTIRKILAGVRVNLENGLPESLLKDWTLLQLLNDLSTGRGGRRRGSAMPVTDLSVLEKAVIEGKAYVEAHLEELGVHFAVPDVETLSVIWPRSGQESETLEEENLI